MPPSPTEQERAWQLVIAIVENDNVGPPRNSDNDDEWVKIMYRALQLSVLYSSVVSSFP